MSVFVTSDLHIGHNKVAEIRAQFWTSDPVLLDPFYTTAITDWHDRILAANWDARVKPDDTVWVLGDISAGGSAAQKHALEWIRARNGIKHLIAGNHDGCHPMHRDSHKWQKAYLGVFQSVQMAAKRRVTLKSGHTSVYLSHFPFTGDHGPDRHQEWRLREGWEAVIHGHTHSAEKISHSDHSEALQVHVGVDAWNFQPAPWDTVCDLIRAHHT